MYVIISSICLTPYAQHMTSHPLFMTSQYCIYDVKSTISNNTSTLSDITSCICVITPTLSMRSQPAYVWYHIEYTCYILYTIFMTSYPLCMTTQHCVLLIPHSAYVWYHLHYRCYNFHSIAQNDSIYDFTCLQAWHHTHCMRNRTHCIFVITTPPLISYPILYDIISPL